MTLESIIIKSADRERAAWIVEGPATPHSLCVLLDGEHYRDGVHALPLVSTLPMTVVFVESGGGATRHQDYVYDAAFARFVAEDVMRDARARAPSLTADGHLICGLSLSGLAAAHIALLYPALFPAVLCQSGSFWLQPETFAQLARQHAVKSRFWLSVGDEETDVNVSHPPSGLFQAITQIEGVERARAALVENGADVHLHRYRGGHKYEHWEAELGDALRWLSEPRP